MITDPARIENAVMKPTNPYGYEKPDMTAAVITIKENQIVVIAATNIEALITALMIFPYRYGFRFGLLASSATIHIAGRAGLSPRFIILG